MAFAAAVGLLLASAAAATATTPTLRSTEISLDGAVTSEGPLLGLTRFDLSTPAMAGGAQPASLSPAFDLLAGDLLVRTHEANFTARGPRGDTATFPYSYEAAYGAAQVQGDVARAGYRFEVYPLLGAPQPTLSLTSTCAQTQASTEPDLRSERKVDTAAPEFVTDTSNALQWTACGPTELTIAGSFVVVLWQWDATVEHGGATSRLHSGVEPAPVPDPLAAAAYPTVSKARQQYLYATDATLTIPQMDASSHLLYLAQADVAVGGQAVAENATGALTAGDQQVPVSARSLTLKGDLQLDGLRSLGFGQGMAATAQGTFDQVQADGAAVPLATTVRPPATPWWPWALGLVVLGTLVVPAALHGRRRLVVHRLQPGDDAVASAKARMFIDDAYQCLARRDIESAGTLARRAVRLDDSNPEGHFLQALCAADQDDLEQAVTHHVDAEWRLQLQDTAGIPNAALRAENAFNAALVQARLARLALAGRRDLLRDEAKHWLDLAIRQQPGYAHEARGHPVLGGLVHTPTATPDWMLP